MSTSSSLNWLDGALEGLQRAGLRRERRVGSGLPAGAIDFGSNDYLGLAGDPRLAEAAAAAGRSGWGAGASPVVSGRSALHAELERRLAEFEGAEGAILFPSGFAAGAGVIPALVDEGDAVYADAKNHASLIDGCRLTRAERRVYPHNAAAALRAMLEADAGRFRRRLIVTDGLFSMDGDFAPLAGLGELAAAHDAMLVVDEAHATGVWGPSGRGSVEAAAQRAPALESQVAVRIGTLSKALGSAGGFVTGSAALIDWLHNRARSYVFSTAAPPAVAAAAIASLEIVRTEPERRERVRRNAERLRGLLGDAGWNTGQSTSQIVPIVVGAPERAVALAAELARRGFYVPAIRPPSVPAGESLLRVSVSARHGADDLRQLVEALGPAPDPAQPG
ncbi:8-amino-7-oxononanoate synthase 2 [Botrimarina colliarenosi]|uniref:8-amino-7-oxononanoate synthase n=1 Tax=Botrimarina colliarenosi TaxID=2528001 RepID=A0A5C6ANX4_9BACT|nr:8-amino-7-oxononanoate synthase [Botrimarina colliarenosi]TWU00722.1 8-amino-7-oxononanoate synthase 2 [Botrimarina colliarenosi]